MGRPKTFIADLLDSFDSLTLLFEEFMEELENGRTYTQLKKKKKGHVLYAIHTSSHAPNVLASYRLSDSLKSKGR